MCPKEQILIDGWSTTRPLIYQAQLNQVKITKHAFDVAVLLLEPFWKLAVCFNQTLLIS